MKNTKKAAPAVFAYSLSTACQFLDTPKMQDFIHDTIYYLLLWRFLFLFRGEYVKLIKADCGIFVKARATFGFIAMENTNACQVAECGIHTARKTAVMMHLCLESAAYRKEGFNSAWPVKKTPVRNNMKSLT